MKGNMTQGNPFKLILAFSIPLLLGNLFQQFYNIVDTAIVGQTLGSVALAGVGSTTSVQFLVIGFCQGLTQGFAILVAQRFGAKDINDLRNYVFNSVILTIIFALLITLLTVLLTPNILSLLSVNAEIYDYSYQYIVVIFMGIPFTLLYNYLSAILRAIGDSKTPFYFLAFSAILNIFLDFYCILVLNWGTAGAAIATVFSQGVSGILCLILIVSKFDTLHPKKENRKLSVDHIKSLCANGLPMGFQMSIIAIGSMVMQAANNGLGTVYVSAFASGAKIKQLMMCPFDAFGGACSTFLSQNFGALKMERIKEGFKTSLKIALIYGVFAGVILFLFGRNLSMLFLKSDETLALDASYKYLRRMGYFYPVLGSIVITRMALQGLGYSFRAVVAGIIEMFARTIVSFTFVSKFGFDAITFTDQVAWITALMYLLPMFIYTYKHVSRTIEFDKKYMEKTND